MIPGTYNFTIYQGSTFSARLHLATSRTALNTPRDLSDFSARMQVRRKVGAPLIIELSSDNGRAVIGEDNRITLSISATDTAALAPGKYVYDLELVAGSVVNKALAGTVTVIAEVTV